ncbi:MAG TPA: MdtA/MuxA family multidrug efflux RND transporter periplasmic adaptor subunit [Mycobacterium sp.]|nr:MdtA/MuxA family multidrug efflux RND transporter periplasmic adaptor subunit [Mycobacterium sp.]
MGLLVVIGLMVGGYELFRLLQAPQSRTGRPPQTIPQPVGAATIGTGDIRVIVNALGTVTPLATVTVKTQINGQLTEVGFKEGQTVKKGDFLAQVDPRPYEAAEQQAEGQLMRDQGLLDQARMDLTRYENLAKTQAVPRQQAEDQIYIVKQYEGTVKADQAQVDTQKLNLVYCHIVSPVDGRVGLRLVDPGNYVQTSDTSGIAVITQLQPISVIFPVPEDNLPQILDQTHAGTPLEVTAYDRADVTKLATGKVTALDGQIDTTTGTVKLRAQFDNADEKLFPNQFVNARLLVSLLHGTVTVPTAAVQRGAPGTYVYLINADNTVSVRPVKLGPTDGEMTAVETGLVAGDRVVIDGADRLRDGSRVTIPEGRSQGHGGPGEQPPRQGMQSSTPDASQRQHHNRDRQQGSPRQGSQ